MLFASCGAFASDAKPFVGDGSVGRPYIIKTEADYKALAQCVKDGETFKDMYFKQTADIVFEAPEYGKKFSVGMGTEGEFAGVYDGGGHYITIASSYNELTGYQGENVGVKRLDYGLFGNLAGTVMNLNADGYVSTANDTGIFAGTVKDGGKIINCAAVNIHSYPRLTGKTFFGLASTAESASAAVINCVYSGMLAAADVGKAYPVTNNADAVVNCSYVLYSTQNDDRIERTIANEVQTGGMEALAQTMNENLSGVSAYGVFPGDMNLWEYYSELFVGTEKYSSGEGKNVDDYTTKQITPWIKKYYMTTEKQIEQGYHGGDAWQRVMCMDISAADSDKVLFGTDTSGIWTTSDGGNDWNNTSSGFDSAGCLNAAFDPMDDSIVYAIGYPGYQWSNTDGSGVYISEDGGITWRCVLSGINFNQSQHGGRLIAFETQDKGYSKVFLATYGDGIYTSDDKGESWNAVAMEGKKLLGIEYKNGVFASLVQGDGIYVKKDADAEFNKISLKTDLASDEDIISFSLNPSAPGGMAYVTPRYLYYTADLGATVSLMQKYVYENRLFTTVRYTASPDESVSRLYITKNLSPLCVSGDNGATYTESVIDNTLSVNPTEAWYQNYFAVSPSAPDVVYCATPTEIFKSTDGAKNFSASSSGYSGMRAVGFAFDPNDDYNYWFSFVDVGVVKSVPSGNGERYPAIYYAGDDRNGIRYNGNKTCPAIAMDPKNPQRILISVGSGESGTIIKETTDGGKSYREIEGTNGSCTKIAFHAQNPDVIYAGRYISRDDGKTFTDCGYEIREVSPVNGDVVWAVKDGSIYRSLNGGVDFSAMNIGIGGGNIKIVADKFDERKLYVCDYNRGYKIVTKVGVTQYNTDFPLWCIDQDPKNPLHLVGGGCDDSQKKVCKGIYESFDGGITWRLVTGLTGSADVWGIAFHPHLPQVYVGTSSGMFVYEYQKYSDYPVCLQKVYGENKIKVSNTLNAKTNCVLVSAHYSDGENPAFTDAVTQRLEMNPYEIKEYYSSENTKWFVIDGFDNIKPLSQSVYIQ